MSYQVIILPSAEDDIVQAASEMSQYAGINVAADWVASLQTAINTLAEFPLRCPLAPEDAHFSSSIRQLLHGKKRQQYRVLYTVQPDAVYILHVRHAIRSYLQ